MKNALILIALLLSLTAAVRTKSAATQDLMRPARVEFIEFYGSAGLDVERVRAALPVREGETFTTLSALDDAREQIKEAVRRVTGRPATDVALVSPGQDVWLIFVGLSGDSTRSFRYHPAPKGAARLPADALEIYRRVEDAFGRALQRGAMGEDDSKGYLLSSNDAELRARQLAMREYAVRHEGVIRAVLRSAADGEQRAMAAHMRGYTNQSARQIADLVWASHDGDERVRNSATRALGVLARSDPKVAARIPAGGFIEMLNSGIWTDRNKAGALLDALSQWRAPKLLAALRAQALPSLLEMARWRPSHAYYARVLLGRMAGIEEERLVKLARDNGRAEAIISAALRKQ